MNFDIPASVSGTVNAAGGPPMDLDSELRALRAARDAFAREHNYDIKAMGAFLRELNLQDDRPVVRLPPRRPAGYVAPQSADRPAEGPDGRQIETS